MDWTKTKSIDKLDSMSKVITIHEAKTHFSKYVKQALAGKPVYIGSYGKEEVMLVPAKPKKKTLKIGMWDHKYIEHDDKDLVGPDPDIIKMFEDSLNKPFPDE